MNWLRCSIPQVFLQPMKKSWFCNQLFSSLAPTITEPVTVENLSIRRGVPHTRAEMYQKLLMLRPDTPADGRVLKVSVLGFPNAGKSSLVNMLAGWRVCATAQKINTTRSKQSVVFTNDNVQLIFLDLPGVTSKEKMRQHRLDKTLIRDPHAGIFESDLILVIVDVNEKYKREEMDKEILKALHFFSDKPSILVLNKVDRIKHTRTRLLDYTRKLTGGVVSGRVNHRDKYANRHLRDTPTVEDLLEGAKTLDLLKKHEARRRLNSPPSLQPLEDGQLRVLGEPEGDDQQETVDVEAATAAEETVQEDGDNEQLRELVEQSKALESSHTNYLEEHVTAAEKNSQLPTDIGQEGVQRSSDCVDSSMFEVSDRSDSQAVRDDIDHFFRHSYRPDHTSTCLDHNEPTASNAEDMDPVLMLLKSQLMLHSASPQEVARRRQRWREIGEQVARETSWPHFEEVFMVSSATGVGIENLRNYLISQSKPGLWSFHSSLVTDEDPHELVRMCVWAHFLDVLSKEVPYQIVLTVDDYDKNSEGTIFVKVTAHCRTERHLMHVIGIKGGVIKEIAAAAKRELMTTFQTNVVLKLAAVRATIPKSELRSIKKSGDFRKAFPSIDISSYND